MANKVQKVYSSPSNLVVTVSLKDKRTDIKFNGAGLKEGGRSFTTKDKAVQEALEKTSSFNQFFELAKTITLEEQEEVKEPESEVTMEDEEVKTTSAEEGKALKEKKVDSLAEAKKWLARDLKVKVYPSMNTVKATELAQEKGFELIIEK